MADPTKTAPSNEQAPPSEGIIIAEDSVQNQKILHHLATKLGYHTILCRNGQEAWDKLNEPEQKNVVAILSDLIMPVEDGLTLLKKIRESEKFKNLPVIIVTASSEKEHIMQAKNLSVSGYILKPVSFPRIISKLKELFPNKKFPDIAA